MNWVHEKQAAEMINRKPRTLRSLVQSGKLPIEYTHINNRTYQYKKSDIDRILQKNSSGKTFYNEA